jgi:predicted xylose isomerase-like sugar epimerase
MTASSADLFRVAERLDESPTELLNGGATDALRLLDASASEIEAVARTRGIELSTINALWERAGVCLREVPEADAVFSAAANAATLLYTAAWVLESDSATTEDLKALL